MQFATARLHTHPTVCSSQDTRNSLSVKRRNSCDRHLFVRYSLPPVPQSSRSLPALPLRMTLFLFLLLLSLATANKSTPEPRNDPTSAPIRVATFNAALNRRSAGALLTETATPTSDQIRRVAATLQIIDADIILLNEVDYDATGATYDNLRLNYFSIPQSDYLSFHGVDYPFVYAAPSNTGVLSNVDLDGDGRVTLPSDAYGFGFFEGQFAFVLFSKYEIIVEDVRTFQEFLWKDMPRNLLPRKVYSKEAIDVLRLSSKNHADIPVRLPSGKVIHILASHPTPPVFDSEADENGRRNADEIRFWADYVTPGLDSYIVDDHDKQGGLGRGETFFICGDLNADPYDGDGRQDAMALLLSRYNFVDPLQSSEGGTVSENDLPAHVADGKYDTAFFSPTVGNLRVDYVLPSSDMDIRGGEVFWPKEGDLYVLLVNGSSTSDHRAVFADVIV